MVSQTEEIFDRVAVPNNNLLSTEAVAAIEQTKEQRIGPAERDLPVVSTTNDTKTQLFDSTLNSDSEVEFNPSTNNNTSPTEEPESTEDNKISPIDAIANSGYLLAKELKRGVTKIVTGLDENNPEQRKAFNGMFSSALGADVDYDPRKKAWCATFVHHILTKLGADTLNPKDKFDNIRADKYKNYGTKIEYADIQEGDIVVLDFDSDGKGDHVGFYAGTRIEEPAQPGFINIVGGNQGGGEQLNDPTNQGYGGAVTIRTNVYKTSAVVAVRRITYNDITFELNAELAKENPVFKEFTPSKLHTAQLQTETAGYNQGGLELNNSSIDDQMKIFDTETAKPTTEPLTPVAYTPEEFDGEDKSKDGFLDTAFENAETPLLEARDLFLSAGSGAVFDMLPQDDPRLLKALARTNDYIAGTGYAGWKTGEAAVGFVLGAIADFIGQDEGEPLAGILGTESQANKMLYSMPESFAGSAGTRSLTVLDDALDSLPQAVSMLANKLPLIKSNLTGSLKSLADGDLAFLKESANPPKSLSAASTNSGTNPTLPKSQVAPLLRDRSADVDPITSDGDFYSPILANLDNLAIGPEGMLGSNIVKFLTNKASNINKTELNWSQLLYSGERVTATNLPRDVPNLYPYLGIDPKRKYTKTEIKQLAKENVPQIDIETRVGGGKQGATGNTTYEEDQRIPVFIGEDLPTNLTFDRSDYQGWADAVTNNNPDFTEDVIEDILNNFDDFEDYTFNRFANGIRNTPIQRTGTDNNYIELFINNRRPLGNKYRKARGHFESHEDGETIVAHARGSFYDLPSGKKVFVAEELQSDAVQTRGGGGRPATEETTNEIKSFVEKRDKLGGIEGPSLGSVENEKALTDKLSILVQKNYEEDSVIPSSRFNRFAGIEGIEDPFALQKQEEALEKISLDVNEMKRTFDKALDTGNDIVDARNIVLRYLSSKYEKYGITIRSLERGTGNIVEEIGRGSDVSQKRLSKILTNFMGDLIYTKTVVRTDELEQSIKDVLGNIERIKEPTLDLVPAKLGETVRLSLLALMREAKTRGVNTIIVPPIEDLVFAHDASEKALDITYQTALLKALKQLKSETNNKITFNMNTKIKEIEFQSRKNYPVITFTDLEIPQNSQIRFAEGGVVVPMEQELQMQNMLQQGGIRDDGMNVDPVSGNEVPSGSLASEVRDDIPAQLSEGEYVVPADVVRYFGVRVFEEMRMEAKQGLQTMEKNGRIGGEPVSGPNQMPVNSDQISDIDIAEIEKMLSTQGMADGGLAHGGLLDKLVKAATTDPLINERMKSSGMPMKMAVGGSVGQQSPTSSLYSDPKKIDDIIAKISSAASQNPQLMRMLGERGISVPTTVATQTPEQIQQQNAAKETMTPIISAAVGVDMGNYSTSDALTPTVLPANYLIPGAMTQTAVSGKPFNVDVTEEKTAPAVGGFSPAVSDNNPLPACPPGQERNASGICVPRQDYDGSKEDETPIPDPWYTNEDFTNVKDFVSNKLAPEEQQTGIMNLLSNVPVIAMMKKGDKYNNVAETRAVASLALAAGQINEEEFNTITGQVNDYMKANKLDPEWADTFFSGKGIAANSTRKFAGDDGQWTKEEWDELVKASGGTVSDTDSSSSSSSSSSSTTPTSSSVINMPDSLKGDPSKSIFNKSAAEREEIQKSTQQSIKTDKNYGKDPSKVNSSKAKPIVATKSKAKNTTQAQKDREGDGSFGALNKGGLMQKKKK